MFKTNSQLKDELATAQSKITALEADVATQAGELETAQTELATAREDLTAAQACVTDLEATVAEQSGEIETLKADLASSQEEVEAANASAGRKAAEEIANAGHPPVDTAESEEAPLSILEQYQAMEPGPERKAFRDRHAKELHS